METEPKRAAPAPIPTAAVENPKRAIATKKKHANLSDRLNAHAIFTPMVNACPHLPLVNLLFALLQRWLAAWGVGAKPPARFVRVLERTEQALAAEIRAALAEDGVVFPDLDDAGLLAWFAKNHPGSDDPAFADVAPSHGRNLFPQNTTPATGQPTALRSAQGPDQDHLLPDCRRDAGWEPAARKARAPP